MLHCFSVYSVDFQLFFSIFCWKKKYYHSESMFKMLNSIHPKWLWMSNFEQILIFYRIFSGCILYISIFQPIACKSLCLHHHIRIWLFALQTIRTYTNAVIMFNLLFSLHTCWTLFLFKLVPGKKKKIRHVKNAVMFNNMIYVVRLNRSSELFI